MDSKEIRKRFLKFFENRGHKILPSASLVTSDDKGITNSTLFNTAGVQPLIPYLLKGEHPKGNRLASAQKCIRTVDIDEVGDNTHATFFEMLGNWSIGDYFKEDAIKWSYEFLTSQDEGLGLDPTRLYITVFEGNDDAPKDEEAFEIWEKYIPENRIYFMDAKSNWWNAGDNGPCGPDTEIFYDITGTLGDLTKEEFIKADDEQKIVEVWNDVFMEYEKKDGKVIRKLPKQNVDTGAGLERLTAILNEKQGIFETDLFSTIINFIQEKTGAKDERAIRIIADHTKASVFLISDGVRPSNNDRGYILRRLIRRAKYYYSSISPQNNSLGELTDKILDTYKGSDYEFNIEEINEVITEEEIKFTETLENGKKIIEKIIKEKENIDGREAFKLFSTYGYPPELTKEVVRENDIEISNDDFIKDFNNEFKKHQETSRSGAEGKFKGGLSGHSEIEIKYHTATHLLHTALKEVLGDHVEQKGSNITPDRLRFDFSHNEKMTDEEKQKVEDLINKKIKEGLDVAQKDMSFDEAKELGAIGLFEDKYGDTVSVYTIGDFSDPFSRELCGGPHVSNTRELGTFKIKKEEASSAGVRRIKAILE